MVYCWTHLASTQFYNFRFNFHDCWFQLNARARSVQIIWRTVEHLRPEARYKNRIYRPFSNAIAWVDSQNGNLVWTASATCALETTYNTLEKSCIDQHNKNLSQSYNCQFHQLCVFWFIVEFIWFCKNSSIFFSINSYSKIYTTIALALNTWRFNTYTSACIT